MPILTVDDSVDDSVDCSAHSCPGISIPPVSMVPTESGRGGSTTIQSMEYSQTIMVDGGGVAPSHQLQSVGYSV